MKQNWKYFKVPSIFLLSTLIAFVSYNLIGEYAQPANYTEARIALAAELITMMCTILSAIGGLISSLAMLFLHEKSQADNCESLFKAYDKTLKALNEVQDINRNSEDFT